MEDNVLQGEEHVIDNNPGQNPQGEVDDLNLENQQISEVGSDQAPEPSNLKDTVDLLVRQNRFLEQQVQALQANVQKPEPRQEQRDPVQEILESMGDDDFIDKNTFGTAMKKVVELVTNQNQQVKEQTQAEVIEERIKESEARLIQEVPNFPHLFQKYLAQEYFGNQDFKRYIQNSPDPARKAWNYIQGLPEYRQEVLQKKAQQKTKPQGQERQNVTTTGMSGSSPERKINPEKMSLAEIRAESDRAIRGY